MGYVKDPVGRAQAAKTKVQAARLHQDLEVELGLADHGADWDGQAEQALDILNAKAGEQDWGDLSEPDAATAYQHVGRGQRIAHTYAPRLSRRASHALDQAGGDGPKRLRRGKHPAGHDDKPSPRKRVARQRTARRLSAGQLVGALPPVPGVATTRELATTALGGVLALSFLFLLLRDSENPRRGWPSAVQTAVASITNAVMAIVRPVDPLRPRSSAPSSRPTVPASTPTPTSGPTPLPARPRKPTAQLPLSVSVHRAGTP
jgi:hypothetical protein